MGRGRSKSNTTAGGGGFAQLLQLMQPWANGLTGAQMLALAYFQDPAMREQILNGAAPEVAGHLQDALLQAQLSTQLTVFQGTAAKTSLKDAKDMVGKTFENTKFTTAHLTQNQMFANTPPTGGTIYKYTLPKGAQAGMPTAATGKGSSRGEVVTKAGAKFRATNAYKQGNHTVIEMTYVG